MTVLMSCLAMHLPLESVGRRRNSSMLIYSRHSLSFHLESATYVVFGNFNGQVGSREGDRESDKKRHKCSSERRKPVWEQKGAVQCVAFMSCHCGWVDFAFPKCACTYCACTQCVFSVCCEHGTTTGLVSCCGESGQRI